MDDRSYAGGGPRSSSFFYGWYIVGVGILVNIAGTFAFSSTLSIFLKPITEELGVSRGAFSLIRTFEIGVAALIVPLLGPWIDRHGGRGVLVLGVLMEGTGLLLSGLVQSFWQFVLVRCSLVIAGEALLGSLVINVTIAQWFVRKRGRPFGIASVGIAGLNLHIFSYVTDIGYSPLIAASFMSTIALTQLGSTLVWGVLADRFDIRKVSCVQFMIQGVGLVVAISSADILLVYAGFFLYGTGLAGSFVLREVIWANFFGRVSLGTVRGLSLFFSNLFAASGAPFFGFLHDRMGSYNLSFTIFSCALFTSSLLILLAKPPRKTRAPIGSPR